MTNRRRRIPQDIETDLLIRSGRRCCLCYGIKHDDSVKLGQIAHVNQKPDNNRLDNLVWLCFEHHDQFDSQTSQSKNITKAELVEHRRRLYADMELRRSGVSTPQAAPTRERLRKLLDAINPEILRRVDAGEAKIAVMISRPREAELHQLLNLADGGRFLRVTPTGASIIASRGCRIGGHIHDVFDGADMCGYLLAPATELVDSADREVYVTAPPAAELTPTPRRSV